MDAEDVVLGIVTAAGGEVPGRTYLQKVSYFVSTLMSIPLGFGPHYYGPYSPSIAAETDSQVAMGRLREIRESFGSSPARATFSEPVRYTYRIIDGGRQYLTAIEEFDREGFAKLTEIVSRIVSTRANWRQLACAAKLHYLLEKAGGRISRSDAKKEARRVGWELSDPDIDTAIEVLQQLNLVQ